MSLLSSPRDYHAVVLGASGAVGGALTRELLASPQCSGVTACVRRPSDELNLLPGATAKLTVRVVSMDVLENDVASALAAVPHHSAAFCTLGVGQPRKVSLAEHWRVDVEYASSFARACRNAGVNQFSLLTSVGADPGSSTRYLRVKGAIEDAVRLLNFPRASFFRPSLLVTKELRYGLQDRLTQALFPRISWMLPSRFHEIAVDELGRAMRLNAERAVTARIEIMQYAECMRLLGDARAEE